MLKRTCWLLALVPALPGCVLSLSPLPASYGPPQWQPPMSAPVYSTPAAPSSDPERVPSAAPEPLPDSPPPALTVPNLGPTTTPRRIADPRRVCALPE